jgi:hypothetical protein
VDINYMHFPQNGGLIGDKANKIGGISQKDGLKGKL